MRSDLIMTFLVGAVFFAVPFGDAAEPVTCPDNPTGSCAAAAFGNHCRRCHDPNKLATSYFDGADAQVADSREAELALFLDRHGASPHRNHEEIAAWLRNLFNQP